MRRYIALISVVLIFILASCNWDTLSSGLSDADSSISQNSVALFNGDAPKNVYASQATFNGEVVVTFDGVPGADSYTIERIELDKTSDEEPKEEDWRIIATISADANNNSYRYTDTSANNGDKIYLYRVKAGSIYAEFVGTVTAKYSEIAKGWPLSPPTSLTATQGVYENKIILEWTPIDLVWGYNVYYQVKGTTQYSLANTDSLIPAVSGVEKATYEFQPSANDAGVDIYFYVESVSRGNKTSDASGIRTGYTFNPAAPEAPGNLDATDYYSCSYIEVSWDKPGSEGANGFYRWEIYRSTPTTDQVLIKQFNSNEIPSDISPTGDRYSYKDTSSTNNPIEAGVIYTYTVRAVYVESDPASGTVTEMLGRAASEDGCLIVPAVTISDLETDFEAGAFFFTINPPEEELQPTCASYSYGIKGRNNQFGENIGAWRDVTAQCEIVNDSPASKSGIEATDSPVRIKYDYDGVTNDCNEFNVVIIDSENAESVGYAEYAELPDSAIITEREAPPSASVLTVSENKYIASLQGQESSAGVYPLMITINGDAGATYQVEAYKLSANGIMTTQGRHVVSKENQGTEIVVPDISPTAVGEKWYYRVRKGDQFRRYSEWSTDNTAESDKYKTGYGAITGQAFIKFFEAYAMKPWEFINHSDFPQNLKSKWKKSEIYSKINNEDTSGSVTEYSDFHNGSIDYNVKADIMSASGIISFNYTNFGELETMYTKSGSYSMSVKLSGSGSISANTPFYIEGMYPATVRIDPAHMSVSSKAFKGDYVVIQENGKGEELVEATRN